MGQSLRTTLARRLGFLMAGTLSALGVGAVTAQAASPVVQETVPIQSVYGSSVVDPCNGEVITWTGDVHLVASMTTDANGGAVFAGHLQFRDVHGTDPTGTRYTIPWDTNDVVVFAPSSPALGSTPNVETHVISLPIISDGPSPNFYDQGVLHYTVTPDGQIAVAFVRETTRCSS
jgi:hypothetical protein